MLKSTGSLRPYRTHWRMLYRDFLQWDSTEAASRSRGPASMHVKAMPCHAAQAPAAQLKPVCISWSQSCFAWSDPSHMPVRLYATFVFSDVNNKPRHPHKQEMLRKKKQNLHQSHPQTSKIWRQNQFNLPSNPLLQTTALFPRQTTSRRQNLQMQIP